MNVDMAARQRIAEVIRVYKIRLKCSPEELADLVIEALAPPKQEVRLSMCCQEPLIFSRETAAGAWQWRCSACREASLLMKPQG